MRPLNHKLEWTDKEITEDKELGREEVCSKYQIKLIHIEDLRHFIPAIFEDYTPEGTLSLTASKPSSDFTEPNISFNDEIQKRRLWDCTVIAGHEFINHAIWDSNALSTINITDSGNGSIIANAIAYRGSTFTVGTQIYPAVAIATSEHMTQVPITLLTSQYPLVKQILNEYTQQYDEYHLCIKATTTILHNVVGSYAQGTEQSIFLAYSAVGEEYKPQAAIDWDNASVIPNTSPSGKAEIKMDIGTLYHGVGGGLVLSFRDGSYLQSSIIGIAKNLSNFDLDLAQEIETNFSMAANGLDFTYITFGCQGEGTANSLDMKSGNSYHVVDPLNPFQWMWFGLFKPSGGRLAATASYTIDDIQLYYKKI
jgi:hypothetical protein